MQIITPSDFQGKSAFTLIELSIVLVIIGLIVGGILTGRDLINAAGVRAQVAQIEKYQQAVNTFRGKYGALPGDIDNVSALRFGLAPRGSNLGQGDANGIIEGVNSTSANNNYGFTFGAGETLMVWVDLSAARLIDERFTAGSATAMLSGPVSGSTINNYFPPARIGQGNYVYIYSSAYWPGANSFGISAIQNIVASGNGCGWCMASSTALSAQQAYSIDAKIDDGLANKGRVAARYMDYSAFGSSGVGWTSYASSSSGSTCFETTTSQYSYAVATNALNCALAIKFQ